MKVIYIASCEKDGGIYRCALHDDGKIEIIEKTEMDRPMYMAKYEDKMYVLLRAPFEDSDGEDKSFSGLVQMRVNGDGSLSEISEAVSTKGIVACHLYVCKDGVYVVNYLSGNVIKMPNTIDTHTQKSIHPTRQSEAHTHFVCETPDKKYICVTDLGEDRIYFYDKALKEVSYVSVPSGSGARHVVFSEDGKYMYCANELSSSVSVFGYENGRASLINTYSALPNDFTGENTSAAIRLYDKHLYVSNRGHNSIVCFKIDGEKLILESVNDCGGKSPRDFNIIDGVMIITNENSDNVTVYKVCGADMEKVDCELNIKSPLCVI